MTFLLRDLACVEVERARDQPNIRPRLVAAQAVRLSQAGFRPTLTRGEWFFRPWLRPFLTAGKIRQKSNKLGNVCRSGRSPARKHSRFVTDHVAEQTARQSSMVVARFAALRPKRRGCHDRRQPRQLRPGSGAGGLLARGEQCFRSWADYPHPLPAYLACVE